MLLLAQGFNVQAPVPLADGSQKRASQTVARTQVVRALHADNSRRPPTLPPPASTRHGQTYGVPVVVSAVPLPLPSQLSATVHAGNAQAAQHTTVAGWAREKWVVVPESAGAPQLPMASQAYSSATTSASRQIAKDAVGLVISDSSMWLD